MTIPQTVLFPVSIKRQIMAVYAIYIETILYANKDIPYTTVFKVSMHITN